MGEDDAATLSLVCCLEGVFREALAGVEACDPRPERAVLREEGVDILLAYNHNVVLDVRQY